MIESWFNQDTKQAVKVHYLDGNLFSQDNNGNKIGVNMFTNGLPSNVVGTISANIVRSDGVTVPVEGSSDGNQAWVVLPQDAYIVTGVISIIIKATSGNNITTLCAVVANVYLSSTSTIVDPGTIIPSIETLIAEIQAAIASIPADYSSLWESVATPFSTSDDYKIGDYVSYDGAVYKFIANHSGSWSASDVVAVSIGNELETTNSLIGELFNNENSFVMIKERTFNGQGVISTNNALSYAVSSYFNCVYLVSETPVKDNNNIDLSVYVCEWDANGTYLGREQLSKGVAYYPKTDTAYMSIIFGRASSTGVTISNDDINNYLKINTISSSYQLKNGSVQFGNLQVLQGSLNTNYTFVTSAAKSYVLLFDKALADEPEKKYRVRVTANNNSSCVYAFNNTNIIAPSSMIYAGGTVSAGNTATESIPDWTKSIIIAKATTGGTDKTPVEFVIEEDITSEEITENVLLTEIANYGLAFTDDYTEMSDYDSARISTAGYNPASGFSNKVTINRCVVCDTISIKALVHFNNTTSVSLTLGTVDAGFTSSKHATIVKFDFANSKVDFMAGAEGGGNYDGTTLPSYVYDTFSLTNIDGYLYTVEIGRIGRCPYARVWNRKTGSLCGEKILMEYETSQSYGGKAGALYDYPTFSALTDNVYFERIVISAPSNPFAAFVGDSITEGSQVSVPNAWANMACSYMGAGINCGRGGGNIDNAQKCVDGILSVIKPHYVFVTIGTNGGNTSTKLNNLISSIKALGATPVLNCITMKTTSVESVNEQILETNTEHCRFDLATAINNDPSQGQNSALFNSDNLHPNADGHFAMYKEWETNFSNIKAE